MMMISSRTRAITRLYGGVSDWVRRSSFNRVPSSSSSLCNTTGTSLLCYLTTTTQVPPICHITTACFTSASVNHARSCSSSLANNVVKDEELEGVPNPVAEEEGNAYLSIELALDSVVKIFTVSSSPNYLLPWQNKPQRETMGSGFIIRGKRIITNAHVVADHTFVLVRKHGCPVKFRADVQAVGHECDLAILEVQNEEFWEGMNFLELGDIPLLQEAVAVVGYPQGGDNISITKGVVSRVEPTQYVHGASQLMAIQIDAAINPGNSGGPAIMGDKVVGVAFQNLSGAEF